MGILKKDGTLMTGHEIAARLKGERITTGTQQGAVDHHRLVRPCTCKYQAEAKWGYEIQRWIGGQHSWDFVAIASTPEIAAHRAREYPQVLIRCRGCGAEVVREQGSNHRI